MSKLLKDIEHYWTGRAEGYSRVNQEELAGGQKAVWLSVLQNYLPDADRDQVRVLDIGTGPGFFAIILAGQGYDVTAVDYTEEMLHQARANAGPLSDRICFKRMDAQNLDLEDDQFDLIVSRNVTWNLEDPAKAYKEWLRVLKPGGRMLNFDANWYHHLFDEEKRAAYEADRQRTVSEGVFDEYTCTDIDAMEAIARKVPLSRTDRPVWDKHVLSSMGALVEADEQIWQKVWDDHEKVNYASTPMFLVTCIKSAAAGGHM